EHVGLDGERARDGGALPHASRHPGRMIVLEADEAAHLQIASRDGRALGRAEAERLEHECHVLLERQPRQQAIFLEDDADLVLVRLPGHDRLAVERDVAARGWLEAADDPQQRGLATAVGPEETDELARLHPKRDAIDHRDQEVLADLLHGELHGTEREPGSVRRWRAMGAQGSIATARPGATADRRRSCRWPS